jgi:SAM-dependent methyltransferase
MSDRVFATYEALWGELMFVMHDDDHLRIVNRGRADWLESLGVPGRRVLDLGSGNGYFDVELGRRGYAVVAVEQVRTVVESARQRVDGETVDFIPSDLRQIDFPDVSFDAITLFGLVGLMSRDDDTALLAECYDWLVPGGWLVVDCDTDLATTHTTEDDHPLGVVRWQWTNDPETRTNILTPELLRADGVTVGLKDPIDETRGDHEGLRRYIYPKQELATTLTTIGFSVEPVGHYVQHVYPGTGPQSYMLKATRKA